MDQIKLVPSPNEIAHFASVPCTDWLACQPNGAVCFFFDGSVAEFTGRDRRSGSAADANHSSNFNYKSASFFETGAELCYANSEFFFGSNASV